jgi:transposase-like protein
MQKATTRGTREVRRRPRRTRAQWLEAVNQWRASEQSVNDYTRTHDLHPGTFAVWASRFRNGADSKPAREITKGTSATTFLPVRVSGATRQCEVFSEMSIEGGFEVVLTIGRRVRVAGNFHPQVLAQLIAVVEGGAAC